MLPRLLTLSGMTFFLSCSFPTVCLLLVVQLLHSWYVSQHLRVRWGGAFSSPFAVSNGVQGNVLSPILFALYLDELLVKLQSDGVGCYWGHHFVGPLAYADDIVYCWLLVLQPFELCFLPVSYLLVHSCGLCFIHPRQS